MAALVLPFTSSTWVESTWASGAGELHGARSTSGVGSSWKNATRTRLMPDHDGARYG